MKASYTGANQQLRTAAAYVNQLDANGEFWRQIGAKPDFTYSRLTSQEIERRLKASDLTVRVRLWTPKPSLRYKYRNTIAVTRSSAPNTLFYHTKFLTITDVADKVNTIVHEFVHNVDAFDDGQSGAQMGHGDNSAAGKDNSAPYWIGNLAERLYRRSGGLLRRLLVSHTYRHREAAEDDGDVVIEVETPLGSYDEEASHLSFADRSSGLRALALPALLAGAAVGAATFWIKRNPDR